MYDNKRKKKLNQNTQICECEHYFKMTLIKFMQKSWHIIQLEKEWPVKEKVEIKLNRFSILFDMDNKKVWFYLLVLWLFYLIFCVSWCFGCPDVPNKFKELFIGKIGPFGSP